MRGICPPPPRRIITPQWRIQDLGEGDAKVVNACEKIENCLRSHPLISRHVVFVEKMAVSCPMELARSRCLLSLVRTCFCE